MSRSREEEDEKDKKEKEGKSPNTPPPPLSRTLKPDIQPSLNFTVPFI
jgi:hypothetical protein